MLYALLAARKGWSQPGFELKTPLAFRSSLLWSLVAGMTPGEKLGTGLGLQKNPQTMGFPCSHGCRGTIEFLNFPFGCSMTASPVCLLLSGPRSVVFLKAVNQVRNN